MTDTRADTIVETERLRIRRFHQGDAAFALVLLNEPAFLHYIGDKGVRTLDDARRYLRTGPLASYETHGFGPWLVERRADGLSIGLCGLLRREALDAPDLGFAFLESHWAQGYAHEASSAVMRHVRETLWLTRIVAVTTLDNEASARLLGRLGFSYARMTRLADDEPELRLFVSDG